VDPPLALDLPASVELAAEAEVELADGHVTWSYGDPDGRGVCTAKVEIQGDPPEVQVPATVDCEPDAEPD
jgi:hypothetical protein